GLAARAGFTELTEQIALGQVGVVLALEVSRLARSSAECYRLLDLCGITDTLIADEASVYHPGMFDDRLGLGLKGTMAGSELWLRENGLQLPSLRDGQLAWSTAAYPAVHKILTHPAYAGAYVYGRTRAERYIDASGSPAAKRRAVPRPEDWQVLITGHHPGYI